MELNKDIALQIALERILALEDELIYAKTIIKQMEEMLSKKIEKEGE